MATQFERLIEAIKGAGGVLSDRHSRGRRADEPPAYMAHLILEDREYLVTVVPTKLAKERWPAKDRAAVHGDGE